MFVQSQSTMTFKLDDCRNGQSDVDAQPNQQQHIDFDTIFESAITLDSNPDFRFPLPDEVEPTPIRILTIRQSDGPAVNPVQVTQHVPVYAVSSSSAPVVGSAPVPTGFGLSHHLQSFNKTNVPSFDAPQDFDNLLTLPDIDDISITSFDEGFDMDFNDSIVTNIEQGELTEISSRKMKTWPEQYCDLVAFFKIHGHTDVTPENDQDFPKLLQWVKRQRYLYKLYKAGKSSTMNEAKLELLQRVNFIWNSHHAVWETRFQELLAYRSVHGHCNVPRDYQANKKLSSWVKRQRGEYNKRALSPQRIERLEAIDFVWDILYYRAVARRQAAPVISNKQED